MINDLLQGFVLVLGFFVYYHYRAFISILLKHRIRNFCGFLSIFLYFNRDLLLLLIK